MLNRRACFRCVRQASGGHSESSFANITALKEQQERQRKAGLDLGKHSRTVLTMDTPGAAAARVAYEEAKARRLAAEAAVAQAKARLTTTKSSGEKKASDLPKALLTSAPVSRSDSLASKPKQPKPRKVSSLFHNLVLGLNVQARAWEAPTKDLIALEQARRTLGTKQFVLDKRTKVLKELLNEVRARGGDDADAIKVLRDYIDRKISDEEAEKRLKALEDVKKSDDKGMSLAEREELARLEIKAQQLTLQKLVRTVL